MRSCGRLTSVRALIAASLIIPLPCVADERPPRECELNASADTGQPVMFPRGRLLWGLSTKPVTLGQKLPVMLWIYNPTDEPLYVTTCGDIEVFWQVEIHVFDSTGKRVESRAEGKRRAEEERSKVDGRPLPQEMCLRNIAINLACPRTPVYMELIRPRTTISCGTSTITTYFRPADTLSSRQGGQRCEQFR
jgi:hypothetical protein